MCLSGTNKQHGTMYKDKINKETAIACDMYMLVKLQVDIHITKMNF